MSAVNLVLRLLADYMPKMMSRDDPDTLIDHVSSLFTNAEMPQQTQHMQTPWSVHASLQQVFDSLRASHLRSEARRQWRQMMSADESDTSLMMSAA
jgi:hypothetical protein